MRAVKLCTMQRNPPVLNCRCPANAGRKTVVVVVTHMRRVDVLTRGAADHQLDPFVTCMCLQCFDAVGWAAGRAHGLYKAEWLGAGVVMCLERGVDLHMAQTMPLPLPLTVSCFSKIQIGFAFLVPAHLGSPGKKGR